MKRRIKKRADTCLLAVLLAMLVFACAKDAAVPYIRWQWLHTDKLAGYIYKTEYNTIFDKISSAVMPALAYAQSCYVSTGDGKDPSYIKYMDKEYITANENTGEMTGENDEYTGENSITDNSRISDKADKNVKTVNNINNEESSNENSNESSNDTKPQAQPAAAPVKYSINELCNYDELIKKLYIVTSITSLKKEVLDVEDALAMDMTIKQDNTKPQILIFHTHSQENFTDSAEGDINTGIVGVGQYLADILQNKYGYNVIHDTSVYDFVDGKLDRSKAYTYAEKGIEKILNEYPSIEVIIDLHRDGVSDDTHLVTTQNGKKMAQVMLFNGVSYTKINGNLEYLPNSYLHENLAASLQLKLLGDAYYPGLFRKNYINGYRYCLHYRGKSFLIEAGAQNNTYEEEINAMEPLADVLDRMLRGQKAYK